MDGLLLIDKPIGWTSFDVVNKVRGVIGREIKSKKRYPVGHAGTLDPLATGLLILLVGSYTKKAAELVKLDKCYDFTMKLGFTSTSQDEEGEKTMVSTFKPTRETVNKVARSFEKTYQQIPPAYSAIKVNGKRSYQLARQGSEVVLQPRTVTVKKLEVLNYSYPLVELRAAVSSGTYIRSLANDMGEMLKTGGYVTALKRTKVGHFDVHDAIEVEKISIQQIETHLLEF
jgi:tRNA pseudouridine55 synthase